MTDTVSPDLGLLLASAAPSHRPAWRTILLAIDGSPACDSAVSVARELAVHTGAALTAIVVCGLPTMIHDSSAPVFDELTESTDGADRAAAVAHQLDRLLDGVGCPIAVHRGDVTAEVVLHARAVRADLIVVGRGRQDLITRIRGEGHVMQLVRAAPCPVLAVAAGHPRPKRVVIGVDFSPRSADVVHAAMRVAADGASFYLLHVKPDPPFGLPHPGRWLQSYDAGVRAGLERLVREMAFPASCTSEAIVVHGHPGEAILKLARTAEADLIAVGRQGASVIDRILVGSVTTRLVHSAPCSLLVVPGAGR